MAINAGTSTPSAYKMGSSTVAAVYCGSTKVWPVNTVPGTPTSVTATAGNTQVSLSWTAPSSNGGASITDYSIQYSSNSGSTWTSFSHTASTSTSITVTGLTNGTAYLLRVAAINSVGTGSYAQSSSVTPTSSGAFYSPSSSWTAVGFSGSGTAASPYTKATVAAQALDGATIRVTSSGTVRVTATAAHSDYDLVFYKNGTAAYTRADNTGGNGFDGSIPSTSTGSCSITVAAGDTIKFANAGDYTNYTSLSIWWQ